MRGILWALAAVAAFVAAAYTVAPPPSDAKPAEDAKPAAPERKATGIEKRELWTKSKVVGSPEPPDPFMMVKTYPKLTFFEALELTPVPGAKAWVVAERPGKVYTFDMDPAKAEKKLVLDVKHTVYGVVLHPKFAENGLLYLSEVPNGDKETPDGTRVVQYKVDPKTMTGDPATAKVIFTWPNGGHNGGCLRFGPDGMLYISTGDGSGIADSLADRPGPRRPSSARFSASTWTSTTSGKAYAHPEGQPVREPRRTRAAKSGPTASASRGRSASTPRPATCGPARSARTCGRWSTASRRAATTAGA